MCTYTAEARELQLHVDNDAAMSALKHAVFKALAKKLAAGIYDPAIAPRAFKEMAKTAARDYCRQYARPEDTARVFPNGAICTYCREMARLFENRVSSNLFGDMHTAEPILLKISGGAAAALAARRFQSDSAGA